MRRTPGLHALWLSIVVVAFTAGSSAARADELNHPGLAVEWMYSTQGPCERMALGDLDGDGTADLVLADGPDGELSVWWNDGHARFDVRHRVPVGMSRRAFAILDADGDGRADIAVGRDGAGGVEIHRGLGGRRFAPPILTADGAPLDANLVVADMNADGRPDLVGVSDSPERTVGIALNAGGGAFTAEPTVALGLPGRALAVADFDGDGWNDVACAPSQNALNGIRILRGNGAGALLPGPEFARQFLDGPRELRSVDLDQDGDADLLSVDWVAKFGVHFNDGAAGFTGFERSPGSNEYGTGIGVAELDGDPAPEVIVSWARHQMGPRFFVYQAGEDPALERGLFHSYYHFHERESAPNQVGAGDLDADGDDDLVLLTSVTCERAGYGCPAPDGSGRIGVVRTRANGSPGALAFHAAVPLTGLRLARFSDGPEEAVLYGGDGIHRAKLGTSGRLEPPVRIADGLEAWSLDANGDGRDDLAIAVTADSLALRLTRRDGTPGEEIARWAGRWVAGGDLGGHPGDELVFLGPDGRVAIAWSHPRHPAGEVSATGIPGPAKLIVLADTGTPHAGLVRLAVDAGAAGYGTGYSLADTAIVYRVLPNGRLHEAARSAIAHRTSNDYYFVRDLVAADVDGRPGDELVILRINFNGILEVYPSLGDGRYSAAAERYHLRPEGPRSIVVKDLDGDGDRDLCWVVQEEGSVDRLHVLWNDGSGKLGDLWTRYLAGTWVRGMVAGDLDGDGLTDLAMALRDYASSTGNRVGILYGDGIAAARRAYGPRNASPSAAAVAAPSVNLTGLQPNPASRDVAVSFALASRAPATLELYDLAGRRVMAERIADAGPGEHTLQLRLPELLRAGVYWLALRQGAAVSSRRITIMR